MTARRRTRFRAATPLQIAAASAGAVFLLVGLLGFVPGVTTGYDRLALSGPESGAMLLGMFAVSVLHNAVHLLFGVVGVALATRPVGARGYLLGGGAVYIALWVYGVVVPTGSPADVVPVNTADNLLHLILGVVMVGLGVALARIAPRRGPRATVDDVRV